jgi:hypothetical protein
MKRTYQYELFFVNETENVLILVKNQIVWYGVYLFFQENKTSKLE